eukprot:scaffold3159_cov191-Alexandrium_tamarense.AAC.18
MFEYDEDDEPLVSAERSGTHHSRTASKFQQWQGMLGTSGDTSGGAGDDSAQIGASGGGSTRTSRCYSARTRTVRRSVNPAFNEEFRFEVADDTLLQDEPLLFHVREGGGQHGSIGLVYVDLNPLLTRTAVDAGGTESEKSGIEDQSGGIAEGRSERSLSVGEKGGNESTSGDVVLSGLSSGVIDGWFPLYDTLGGVRGELELSIKLNFIGDVNPFRDSSAGVQLFPFSTLDPNSGYTVAHVFGFVEELVVADDPEFEWNDNFNQARTSHETRQTLMYLLDAKVRRRMCKKVLEVSWSE